MGLNEITEIGGTDAENLEYVGPMMEMQKCLGQI